MCHGYTENQPAMNVLRVEDPNPNLSRMGNSKMLSLAYGLLLASLLAPIHSANVYNVGDPVPLFVNKVGPLHNPSETYQYYQLPFCHPDQILDKKESLGEILNGDRLANALYELTFAVNKTGAFLCQKKLNKHDTVKFREAIMSDYYYQMYYDDLPMWGFIGKVEDGSWSAGSKRPKYFLFTHVLFDVLYNGNQVIEIHAFSDPHHVADLTEDHDDDVQFSYSISWIATSIPYQDRMARYSETSLQPVLYRTHQISFAFMLCIFSILAGLLLILLVHRLKKVMGKRAMGNEDEEKEIDWRSIHGDTLRCKTNLTLFSAFLGCGVQLLTMLAFLLILAFWHVIYPYSRGGLQTSMLVGYTITSATAGYSSASFTSQYTEIGWERSVLLSGILIPGPFLFTSSILNIMAAYFGVTAAVPLGTVLVIFLLYLLTGVPLLIAGGAIADHRSKTNLQPSPVTLKSPSARENSLLAWHQRTPAQIFSGGLLPFSASLLEFHNFLATLWGYKIYTHFEVLSVTFTLLLMITAVQSICLTYFDLAVEEHEWWWRSVIRGGSPAIFMFFYCTYFYFKSNMKGILQASFFFGYSACMCFAMFLVLGTISFGASYKFVKRICRTAKSE